MFILIKKSYKYKLKTNRKQEKMITSWIHSCRAVYNLALETKIYAYKSHGVSLSKYDLIKQLPSLKKDYDWIKSVPSQTLQNVVERMDTAYQSFFRGGGFPRFARKDFFKSILFKQGISLQDKNCVKLPKIGSLRYFNSRTISENAQIKTAIITKEVDGYYISLSVIEPTLTPLRKNFDNQEVGLDLGVTRFFTLSNGTFKENPKVFKTFERELKIQGRSLARKKKGSNNWRKQKEKLTRLHLKIKRVRHDFLHKNSHELTKKYDRIVIEKLRVKNMTRSAKGNHQNHGKKVKQKSGLNRSLLDVSFSEFVRQLEYKSKWRAKEVVKVDAKYTSQTCNRCGHVSKENRKSQAKFKCVECGYKENADVNAAQNILARAIANVPKRKALA